MPRFASAQRYSPSQGRSSSQARPAPDRRSGPGPRPGPRAAAPPGAPAAGARCASAPPTPPSAPAGGGTRRARPRPPAPRRARGPAPSRAPRPSDLNSTGWLRMNGAMPRPVELPMPMERAMSGSSGTLSCPARRVGGVLHQVPHPGAHQVHRQHLDLERDRQLRPVGDGLAVGGAELARAVHRRGAHQVAHRLDPVGVGLHARGERLHHVRPQPHRAVGPAERQLRGLQAPGLLHGHVPGQPLDVGARRHAVEQREGGVPGLGDDAVRAQLGGQVVRERDQRVGALRGGHRVHRVADARGVELEGGAREAPALAAACAASARA